METRNKIALLVREKEDIWEGCRSALGLAVENFDCQMFVIDVEIDLDEKYRENLEWLKEMECEYYSNNRLNCDKYAFRFLTIKEIGKKLREFDLIVPF